MSEIEDDYSSPITSAPPADSALTSGIWRAPVLSSAIASRANPDDPIVRRPPQGRHGPLPGPQFFGAPGRVAIVQAQVFIVGLILVAQLWLVTTALFELLSGRTTSLWLLVLISAIGFAIVLVVTFWPLRRVRGF